MKTLLFKIYSSSILKILTLCGISTCFVACYGIEPAGFIVNGNVSCKETQEPIEGIVVCRYDYCHEQTDSVGNYGIWTPRTVNLSFNDPAGNYERFDTLIEFSGTPRRGETVFETLDIQLAPKTPEN